MTKKIVKKICEICGREFNYVSKRGRPPIYCSNFCKKEGKRLKNRNRKNREVYPDIRRYDLDNLKTKGNPTNSKVGKLSKSEKRELKYIKGYKKKSLDDESSNITNEVDNYKYDICRTKPLIDTGYDEYNEDDVEAFFSDDVKESDDYIMDDDGSWIPDDKLSYDGTKHIDDDTEYSDLDYEKVYKKAFKEY